MKILLANKFYYQKGGDCIYTIELEALLSKNGNDVAIFAMDHELNNKSKYSQFFPKKVDFSESSINSQLELLLRPIYSQEVKRKSRSIIEYFKPDIIHVNNIHSQLSPILLTEARKKKIPVVWTLHDYKLLCPRYDKIGESRGCDLCVKNKFNVIKNKCLKNSYPASILAYAEAVVWNRARLQKLTSAFVCPSEFMRGKMAEGGYSESQLIKMSNFINLESLPEVEKSREDYYCYVGRLSHEKGVEILLKAAENIPRWELKIIGSGPLEKDFRKTFKSKHITFLGQRSNSEAKEIIRKAKFSVIPSEWYENNPLCVIESLCLGTPVIGANIGGIPELIKDSDHGILFESGNASDLSEKIRSYIKEPESSFRRIELAQKSRELYSSDTYYKKLMNLYSSIRLRN